MKEQFRNWNPKGNINVKYVDGNGNSGIFSKNQRDLLSQITNIVKDYEDQCITLTSRQLYYQLVSRDIIPNADMVYKRICSFLTDARYAGVIDWESIEDRGRVPTKPSEWDNISDLINSAVHSYRLPRWSDQDTYVELYCEKQAMESVLKPVAQKYHIYFGVNKGYSSASTMYDLAMRVKNQMQARKKATVLYLGDHDPSGLDMVRDMRDRINEFLSGGNDPMEYEHDSEDMFEILPLALNMGQIKKYNPPPNPAKITDPRAKQYLAEYGNKSWELDALEPKVLMQIAENGILSNMDVYKYSRWIERENSEKQRLIDFGKKITK